MTRGLRQTSAQEYFGAAKRWQCAVWPAEALHYFAGLCAIACLLACIFRISSAASPRTARGEAPALAFDATQAAGPGRARYVWRNVNITAGGFVDGLIFSPVQKGLIYARTDIGGAYRWDTAASRWIPLNDWAGGKDANLMGCESIGVDPTDANRVYMAAGTYSQSWAGNGAILRSSDQGSTWLRADMPFKMGGNEEGRSIGERLAVDPSANSVLYFGSRHDGLWKSADYGATWSKVGSFPIRGRTNGVGIGFVVFDPQGATRKHEPSRVLYVGVAALDVGLYCSTDGGESWEPVPGQPAGLLPHHAVLDGQANLYVTYGNAPGPNGMTDGAVWKLATRTGIWTDITPVKPGKPSGFGYAGLAIDPRRPGTVMVSTMDRWNPGDDVFRSLDGGAHWTPLRPQAVLDPKLSPWVKWGEGAPKFGWWLGALAIDPFASGHVIYGTGATIWGSQDVTAADTGGATHWSVHAAGLEETAVLCMVSPPGTATAPTGAHLISGLADIGGFRHDDLSVAPDTMWTRPQIDNTDSIDVAPANPGLIVKAGRGKQGQNAALSTDGGKTWAPLPSEPANSRGGGSIAISADGETLVWAATGSKVSYSLDHGRTWTACAAPSGPRLGVFSDRVRSSTFYLRDSDKLFVSHDRGATFEAAFDLPTGTKQVRATPGRSGDLWITAGGGGLYRRLEFTGNLVKVAGVQDAGSIGFGAAATGSAYPALYLTCQTPEGESGVYRSDDVGKSWIRLNDFQHQFGWPGQIVEGDPRIYGRVYLGTNGRGILFGDPVGRQ